MRHTARRSLHVAAVVATCVVLSSCGALTPKKLQGTITGVVTSCTASRPVTVDVLSDGSLVTSATVRSGASFRFRLSPGHYTLRAGDAAAKVALLAGTHARIAFGPVCVGGTG